MLVFRLSFRENPICDKRVVFYCPNLSFIEPLFLYASLKGLCPLISCTYLDEESNPSGNIIITKSSVKFFLDKYFPDNEIC